MRIIFLGHCVFQVIRPYHPLHFWLFISDLMSQKSRWAEKIMHIPFSKRFKKRKIIWHNSWSVILRGPLCYIFRYFLTTYRSRTKEVLLRNATYFCRWWHCSPISQKIKSLVVFIVNKMKICQRGTQETDMYLITWSMSYKGKRFSMHFTNSSVVSRMYVHKCCSIGLTV